MSSLFPERPGAPYSWCFYWSGQCVPSLVNVLEKNGYALRLLSSSDRSNHTSLSLLVVTLGLASVDRVAFVALGQAEECPVANLVFRQVT